MIQDFIKRESLVSYLFFNIFFGLLSCAPIWGMNSEQPALGANQENGYVFGGDNARFFDRMRKRGLTYRSANTHQDYGQDYSQYGDQISEAQGSIKRRRTQQVEQQAEDVVAHAAAEVIAEKDQDDEVVKEEAGDIAAQAVGVDQAYINYGVREDIYKQYPKNPKKVLVNKFDIMRKNYGKLRKDIFEQAPYLFPVEREIQAINERTASLFISEDHSRSPWMPGKEEKETADICVGMNDDYAGHEIVPNVNNVNKYGARIEQAQRVEQRYAMSNSRLRALISGTELLVHNFERLQAMARVRKPTLYKKLLELPKQWSDELTGLRSIQDACPSESILSAMEVRLAEVTAYVNRKLQDLENPKKLKKRR